MYLEGAAEHRHSRRQTSQHLKATQDKLAFVLHAQDVPGIHQVFQATDRCTKHL